MDIPGNSRNTLDQLAEEFVARYRNGERPPLSEYVERYPEHADDIRELFPTLLVVENLKPAGVDNLLPARRHAPLERVGDFRILGEVGRGGMGVVYEAMQESLGRRVALKVLSRQLLDEKSQKRFDREARAAARLHHTNIVPVFGVGEQEGVHYYVMQLIAGQPLADVLEEVRRLRGPQQGRIAAPSPHDEPGRTASAPATRRGATAADVAQSLVSGVFPQPAEQAEESGDRGSADAASEAPDDADPWVAEGEVRGPARQFDSDDTNRASKTARLGDSSALPGDSSTAVSGQTYYRSVARIGAQAADALAYAHQQGVLHRDVKPGNLLLDNRGTVWVTDFGLAKAEDQEDLTHTGDVLGTLRYMAPEMFTGQADARSDIYSLGLTLYEMLALRPAFEERERGKLVQMVMHESPPRLRTLEPHLPRDLETIVHKAIDRDPAHRYQTAEEMAADLERFLHDEPIHARRISPVARFQRWCRRNPAVASLTSAVALLVLAAAVGSSIAAVWFLALADSKAKLAGNLSKALGEARGNLELARAEQQRAEGNVDLALDALDAVYLDAIGQEKLLRDSHARPDEAQTRRSRPLTELEKELLRRGLKFYDQFAQKNAATPRAAVQTAQAYYRVGLLQAALGDTDAAQAAYRSAIERFEKATQDDPRNAKSCFQLARSYSNLADLTQDWEAARPLYRSALAAVSRRIELGPDAAQVFGLRSRMHARLSEFDAAVADAERAIELEPKNPMVRESCVDLLLWRSGAGAQDRDPARAEQHARQLLEIAENSVGGWLLLSQVDYARGKYAQAIEHVDRALAIDPNWADAYVRRAKIHNRMGRNREALEDMDEVVRLRGRPSYHIRAEIRAALGDLAGALDDYQQELQTRPFDANLHIEMGQVRLQMGDYAAALADFNRALERRRAYWVLYKRRAIALFHLGRFDESLADLRRAAELNPDDASTLVWIGAFNVAACPDEGFKQGLLQLTDEMAARPEHKEAAFCLLYRGQLLEAMGREQEGLASFAAALERAPSNRYFWRQVNAYYTMRGRPALALQLAEKTLEAHPDSAAATNCRGQAHLRLGESEKALADFQRAVELSDQANYHSNVALACKNLGRYEAAIAAATEALERNPNDIYALQWRADSCIALNRRQEALVDYLQLVKVRPVEAKRIINNKLAGLAGGDPELVLPVLDAYLLPYNRGVQEEQAQWQAWNRRGAALADIRCWEAAGDDFTRAAELDSTQAVAFRNQANCLVEQFRWGEAADALAKVAEVGAANWRLNYELALCSLGAGDQARYRAACARMLEAGEADAPLSMRFTAWTCALAPDSLEDYEPAIALARQVGRSQPEDLSARNALGAVLFRAGRVEEAIEQLAGLDRPATAPDPGASSSPAYGWYFLAMAYHRAGHEQPAEDFLKKADDWTGRALASAGAPPPWNRQLTLSLLHEEAARALHGEARKIELRPREADPLIVDVLARALDVSENAARVAEAKWKTAVELAGDDPLTWIRRGRWYAEQGDWSKADADFAKAAALTPDELNKFLEAGWWGVGHYPGDLDEPCPPETDPDPSRTVLAADGKRKLQWKQLAAEPRGALHVPSLADVGQSAYFMTIVYSPEERTARIDAFSDCQAQVWVNGRLAGEFMLFNPQISQHVPITLSAGRNLLLVRVSRSKANAALRLQLGDCAESRLIEWAKHGLWQEAAELVQRPEGADLWHMGQKCSYFAPLIHLTPADAGYESRCREIYRLLNVKSAFLGYRLGTVLSLHPNKTFDAHAQEVINLLHDFLESDTPQHSGGHYREALLALALSQYRLEDLAAAAEALDRIDLPPYEPHTASIRAMIAQRRGLPEKAAAWLQKAVEFSRNCEIDPKDYNWSRRSLAFALLLREAESTINGDTAHADALFQRWHDAGVQRLEARDPRTAAYDDVVYFDDGRTAGPFLARARRLAEVGRIEEADADFEQAVRRAPNDPRVIAAKATFDAAHAEQLKRGSPGVETPREQRTQVQLPPQTNGTTK